MAIASLVNQTINQKQQETTSTSNQSELPHAHNVLRDERFNGLPAAQGLYSPENESDACGVGFVCQIKGIPSHKIVSDAKQLLCNMTHRGATGADS